MNQRDPDWTQCLQPPPGQLSVRGGRDEVLPTSAQSSLGLLSRDAETRFPLLLPNPLLEEVAVTCSALSLEMAFHRPVCYKNGLSGEQRATWELFLFLLQAGRAEKLLPRGVSPSQPGVPPLQGGTRSGPVTTRQSRGWGPGQRVTQ